MPKTDELAIKVEGLHKSFIVPTEKTTSLKSLIVSGFSRSKDRKFEVLRDISFEIKHGEFFGIVGKNGSGKSTLLKLLAQIYYPDGGKVHTNGRLTPFIELGVGFNPELTGRENVYLNGALFGIGRKEMSEIYHKIVEFSELHDFMDQKLKNYSSGMQVRLAFSIAIQSRSDILLFDEVLAVGDESFQRKCFDIFEKYKAEGKTIILVSHDMGNVRKFCNRALLLSDGKIIEMGDPNKIAAMYSQLNQMSTDLETERSNRIFRSEGDIKVKIENFNGETKSSYDYGELLKAEISWPKKLSVKNMGVAIMKEDGEYVYGTHTIGKNLDFSKNKIVYKTNLNLGYGRYHLSIGLFGETRNEIIEFIAKGPQFIVKQSVDADWEGLTNLEGSWDD